MLIQTQPDLMYEGHKLLIEGAVFLFAMITIGQLLWLKLRPHRKVSFVSLMKHDTHDRFCFMPLCIVSYVDLDGVRHSVEVNAEGLYEAAVLGLAAFKKHDYSYGFSQDSTRVAKARRDDPEGGCVEGAIKSLTVARHLEWIR